MATINTRHSRTPVNYKLIGAFLLPSTGKRCAYLDIQVTRLCESPFISQAFREQERSERVLELEQGGRAAQLKIDHLQV